MFLEKIMFANWHNFLLWLFLWVREALLDFDTVLFILKDLSLKMPCWSSSYDHHVFKSSCKFSYTTQTSNFYKTNWVWSKKIERAKLWLKFSGDSYRLNRHRAWNNIGHLYMNLIKEISANLFQLSKLLFCMKYINWKTSYVNLEFCTLHVCFLQSHFVNHPLWKFKKLSNRRWKSIVLVEYGDINNKCDGLL